MLALAAFAVAIGCGGPKHREGGPAVGEPGGAYDLACQAAAADRVKEAGAGKYVPVDLHVHQWPSGDAKPITRAFLPEAEFGQALVAPATPGTRPLRSVLVLARGGTGKSKLAWSLEAQLCGVAAVVKVDLNADVAAHANAVPDGANGVALEIAKRLALPASVDGHAALADALDGRPWVMILDSLDEVPLLQRTQVVRWVDDVVVKHAPHVRAIVMTRPPVFTSNYGLATLDAKVEIPPLGCADTEAAIAREVTDAKASAFFKEFATRYGLDRKVTLFDRCSYPHMSTFRDLAVVVRLVRNSAYDKETPEFKTFQSSRAQVYTYFATAQLIKDMQGTSLPAESLQVVDSMMASFGLVGGERNLPFTLPRCVAAVAGDDPARKQPLCERLLQSALFRQSPDPGVWQFTNQTVGDLFLARWLAGAMQKSGKVDCSVVAAKADLLESSEVAGFVVGLPAGQECLWPIAQELCRRSGFARSVVEQLDQGLPSGPLRVELLKGLQQDLNGAPNDPCLTALVDGLLKTVPVDALALPAPPSACSACSPMARTCSAGFATPSTRSRAREASFTRRGRTTMAGRGTGWAASPCSSPRGGW